MWFTVGFLKRSVWFGTVGKHHLWLVCKVLFFTWTLVGELLWEKFGLDRLPVVWNSLLFWCLFFFYNLRLRSHDNDVLNNRKFAFSLLFSSRDDKLSKWSLFTPICENDFKCYIQLAMSLCKKTNKKKNATDWTRSLIRMRLHFHFPTAAPQCMNWRF